MKKLLLIICVISTTLSFAKKWDAVYINKLITKGDIDKVIQHYQDGYFGSNRNPQDAFKIAELYVKKKDYASAMQWYNKEEQLINSSKVNLFNYANTNRLMGEYQKALDGYLMYAANTGDVAKVMDLANQCEKILKLSSQASNYKLDNYSYNTSNNESNIAFLRTNAVYVTTNTEDENQPTKISQVVRSFQNFAEPVKAYQNNIPKLTITSLSYSKDGNTVVFSAIEEKTSNKKNTKINEKLYIANNLGGTFLDAKLIPFNYDGFSFKNPSLNDNATTLYFSSNHSGGFGGFDIWTSNFVNGKWTNPINLGKLVNTKADEISPFIVQDGNENLLYFSSDRESGFGGFDIYTAQKSGTTWQDVEMESAPINSAGDDVSIVYDNEVKTGYFSSNRKGGKGGFDLYRYTPFRLRIIINTTDSATNKLVDYAYAQLNENGVKAFEGVTNENGQAVFQVGKDRTFRINISKDGYRPNTVNVTSIDKANGDSIVINVALKKDDNFSISKGATNTLSLDNYIIFTGHVIDGATNKPALSTKMRMVNYTTQKVRELDLDKDGKFEIKLLLNNNYKVIFENQSAKIFDELTSYGLDKNDVKVRDYLLSSGKFKLTENKVYKNGNLPNNIKVENTITSSVSTIHEPITKSKIDSLLKVIAKDNPQTIQTNKTTAIAKPIEKPAVVAKVETISKPAKVIVEEVVENNNTITNNEIIQKVAELIIEKKVEKVPIEIKAEISKTEIIPTSIIPEKEVEKQTIVVGPGDKVNESKVKPASVNNEEETTVMVADIVTQTKGKRIKIDNKESEENENAEILLTVPNVEPIEVEKPKEIAIAKVEQNKPIIKSQDKIEPSKTIIVNEEIPKVIVEEKVQTKPVIKPIVSVAVTKEPIVEELPEIYFKIQLASYDEKNLQFPEFEQLGKVEMVQAYDKYIYRLGIYTTLDRAKEILDQVRAKGYFVAFILQYKNDKVTGIVK